MIDWALAERLAGTVAGEPARVALGVDLSALAADGERLVGGYTGLAASGPLPPAESITRAEWVSANVGSMRALIEPLEARLGEASGPLAGPLRAVAGYALAAEVGVVLGYLARNVLGQYELVLLDAKAPARLLFVAPNLDRTVRELHVDRDDFMRWVALHEVTHALQFGSVSWLRTHLAALISELVEGLSVRLEAARVMRLPGADDVRRLIDAVGSGDLLSVVATPEQRALLDRVQAVMAVIEGYAEHVMDVVGADVLPTLPRLRSALDRRRASRSAPARLLSRLLGLDLKLRQYQLGKAFCDAVVADAGIAGLNRVWSAPEALPTLEEVADPARWRARTDVPSVTK